MSKFSSEKLLFESISDDCDKAMTLVDVLLEEQTSLITMKTNSLSDLSLKKESLMFKLDGKFKQYQAEADSQGFGQKEGSVRQWVETAAKNMPKLSSTFLTLQNTLEHARHLNATNSNLVAEQLAGISNRIAILTAASMNKNSQSKSATYGPKSGFGDSEKVTSRVIIR